MEQVASRPEHVERARAFTAADLRAVAAAVERLARDGTGADDVLQAVDGLLPVHALSLWLSVDAVVDAEPPVHLERVDARELGRALQVTGRRGRRPFVLVVWRRSDGPPFEAAERDLLDAIAPAVVTALAGRRPARSATQRELVAALARASLATAAPRATVSQPLTMGEERVAALVAQGRSNSEVAFELGLSEHTIKQHLKSIFRKLGVRGRTELALRLARGRGG